MTDVTASSRVALLRLHVYHEHLRPETRPVSVAFRPETRRTAKCEVVRPSVEVPSSPDVFLDASECVERFRQGDVEDGDEGAPSRAGEL